MTPSFYLKNQVGILTPPPPSIFLELFNHWNEVTAISSWHNKISPLYLSGKIPPSWETAHYKHISEDHSPFKDTSLVHGLQKQHASTVLQGGFNKSVAKTFIEDWPACWLVKFLDESSLSVYAVGHPLKPPVHDTWPHWLRYGKNTLEVSSSIFRALDLYLP